MGGSGATGDEVRVSDLGPFAVQHLRDLGRYTIAVLVRDGQLTPPLERTARERGYGKIVDEARRDPHFVATLYKRELVDSIGQLVQADPGGVFGGRYPYLRPAMGPTGASLNVQAELGVLDMMPDASGEYTVHASFERMRAEKERWIRERDSLVCP